MPEPLRAAELLETLLGHGVDFVLIGGFAVAAHGVVRATKDVDVIPGPETGNLERLAEALAALGARLDLRDMDADELGIALDADGLSLGGNWVLDTELGRLDVLQDVAGMRAYHRLRADALLARVPGVSGPVPVVSLEDLLAMKRAAGRDVDLMDIGDLQRAAQEPS